METTIEFKGVVFSIEYDYEPEQRLILHPVDKAQDYHPAQAEITDAWVGDQNAMELLEDDLEEIELLILKQ